MDRENLITYKMMKRLHESPAGLTREDFTELRTDQVRNYMKDLVRRGMATKTKIGAKMNCYSVSDAQWELYTAPVKPHCRPRPRAVVGDDTLYGRLLAMASRPVGICYLDKVAGYDANTISVRLSKLASQGRIIRVKTGVRTNRYFVDQQAADAFKATFVPPAKPKPAPYVKVHKAKIQKGSAFPATVKFKTDTPKHAQTKESARAKWDATPPYLPYDEAGRPLFKVTICPGFTADPRYSNTHFQTA